MKILSENGSFKVIELEHGDQVQLAVPASMGRTCVYLEVTKEGKLDIIGGSSVISKISGNGMLKKFKE